MTDIEMGKYLSYILRHHPEDINIKVDKNGYVNVDELIEKINATEKYKGEIGRFHSCHNDTCACYFRYHHGLQCKLLLCDE